VIVEKTGLPKSEETTPALLKSINQGIDYFNKHQEEAVEHIYTTLDYSKEDATAWLDTVKFADDVAKIDMKKVITNTVDMLKEAKMLDKEADDKVYVKEYDI
jgi:ABC-type nitrate/sulfonate/bicarbonate transport system substrate-binding protein